MELTILKNPTAVELEHEIENIRNNTIVYPICDGDIVGAPIDTRSEYLDMHIKIIGINSVKCYSTNGKFPIDVMQNKYATMCNTVFSANLICDYDNIFTCTQHTRIADVNITHTHGFNNMKLCTAGTTFPGPTDIYDSMSVRDFTTRCLERKNIYMRILN